ncbi:hypothetical protein JIG36_47265 [Actinoplanes sp. LDG1-06]|uniref:Uncharacterized protein n=2 Tax=Paractinoplanes ovalisporus TaxID=2810368 RepID=A0ABS2ATI3_9ACTN|nr:hypothetical protein [Actinoplanes ovalisporus]
MLVAAVAFPAGAWALGWWAPPRTTAGSTPSTGSAAATPARPPVPGATNTKPSATPSAAKNAKTAETRTGPCGRKRGTTPTTRITQVSLGSKVVGYGGEGDTEKLPMAIAATPGGGSWLAWLGTDGKVHLGKLGCDDKLTGKPTTFTGIDLQDVQADANGGVLLLTRKGTCHTGPLCGGESSPCNTMHMVRFDNAGRLVWERQVTNLTSGRGGYDDGARFVWWYQHHGRLAGDGSGNYAAYFGVAITVRNGNCVDIHQGDRMQVVTAAGKPAKNIDVGCSHSWTPRIVWDPRTKKFVTVCATDNGCRIAQPAPYRTVAKGTCDGTLFGGDLVLAKTKGYWTAWSQGGQVRLSNFSGRTVTTGVSSRHPHLVTYGNGRMLLTWQSGTSMRAQVHDSGTAAALGKQFTIAVKDHDYQAFKAYADGSAAYPAAGPSSGTIKIARVMPS